MRGSLFSAFVLTAAVLAIAVGCGDSEGDDDSSGGGGATGVGGAIITGGTVGVGGATGSAGSAETGGTAGMDGTGGTGGSVGSGGSAPVPTLWDCSGEWGGYCICREVTEPSSYPACTTQYDCCVYRDLMRDTCECDSTPGVDCSEKAASQNGQIVAACPPN